MKKESASWDGLMTLAVLARLGSYSACARELGLTHVTVMRRIQRLEAALGAKLLDRGDAGFRLTEAGRKALGIAERMEGLSHQLLREIDVLPAGPAGKIRVTCTEAFGIHALAPQLPEFHALYPRLEIELVLDGRVLSIARRKADIAIRLARPNEPELVAKKIGEISYGLYCNQELAISDDPRRRLCKLDPQSQSLPECEWADKHCAQSQVSFSSNSLSAVFAAVGAGLGCAVLPDYLARKNASLRCIEHLPAVVREIWLAYPKEFRSDLKFRPFIDWLAKRFASP